MTLRNALGDLGLDSTLQAIKDRLAPLVAGRSPVAIVSNGGVEPFVKAMSPEPSDPGLVVRQAGATQTWIVTEQGPVSETHPLPVDAQLKDDNGAAFTDANRLPVDIGTVTVQASFDSVISTVNTTTVPLGANEIFVGQWEEVTNYAAISLAIYTDAGTIMDGAKAQFSTNAADVVTEGVSTIGPGGGSGYFSLAPQARYFRIYYANGPVAQTLLRAEVTFHFQPPGLAQAPVGSPSDDRTSAASSKTFLHGRHSSGYWAALKSTIEGYLSVAVENVVRVRGENFETTGVLTAAAAVNASQSNVAGPARTVVMIQVPEGHESSQVRLYGTFSAGSRVFFEGSADGSDDSWFSLNSRRNSDATTNDESSVLDASPFGGPGPVGAGNSNWRGSPGGVKFYRVRCGTFAAGDAISVKITTSTAGGPIFQQGPPPLPTDRAASGALDSVGDTVEVATSGTSSFTVLATGQWTGKIAFEQTVDGVTWRRTTAITAPGQSHQFMAGTGAPNQSAGGRGGSGGTRRVRVLADTDFAGLANVVIRASAGSFAVALTSPVQIAGLYTASQTLRHTVGITAVRLDPSAVVGRSSVEVLYQATGAANNGVVYVGFANSVTTGNGRALQPGEAWTLDVTTTTTLWAVASNAGQQVQVTELA